MIWLVHGQEDGSRPRESLSKILPPSTQKYTTVCIFCCWDSGTLRRLNGDLRKSFGLALRAFRESRGLTQLQLAERSDLHLNAVGLLERGERMPALDTVFALAKGLGCKPQELVQKAAESGKG